MSISITFVFFPRTTPKKINSDFKIMRSGQETKTCKQPNNYLVLFWATQCSSLKSSKFKRRRTEWGLAPLQWRSHQGFSGFSAFFWSNLVYSIVRFESITRTPFTESNGRQLKVRRRNSSAWRDRTVALRLSFLTLYSSLLFFRKRKAITFVVVLQPFNLAPPLWSGLESRIFLF